MKDPPDDSKEVLYNTVMEVIDFTQSWAKRFDYKIPTTKKLLADRFTKIKSGSKIGYKLVMQESYVK